MNNEWLWASHSGLALDDPDNYEADDYYDVVRWLPLPQTMPDKPAESPDQTDWTGDAQGWTATKAPLPAVQVEPEIETIKKLGKEAGFWTSEGACVTVTLDMAMKFARSISFQAQTKLDDQINHELSLHKIIVDRDAEIEHLTAKAVQVEPVTAIEEARELLLETYKFQSTSPRGQQNINAVLALLDDIENQLPKSLKEAL